MAEEGEIPTKQERNSLLERLGKDNVRKIAGIGLAAMAGFGITGKANVGGSATVEVFNPVTGKNVTVGVNVESTEKDILLGLGLGENESKWDPESIRAYTVEIGGAKFSVISGQKTDLDNPTVTKIIAIHAGVGRLEK